jgi:hypothetical protein
MRWGGHVERIRESRNASKVLIDTSGRKRQLEDLGVRLRILLKCSKVKVKHSLYRPELA